MNDNIIVGIVGFIIGLALMCVFISDLKQTAAEVEFAKQGLVQSVVEGRIIWVKP